jgi:hypothetical protein
VLPTDVDGLRVALGEGRLRESDHLDVKRKLPGGDPGNNAIAVDLASLALGGGATVVGIDDPTPAEERQQAHRFVVARPLRADAEMLQAAVGDRWQQHADSGWCSSSASGPSP